MSPYAEMQLMTLKTASGIKRFQEDKELGNWFGKLLPVISSMDNCQPRQSIKLRPISLPKIDEELDDEPEKSNEEDDPGTPESSDTLSSKSSKSSSSNKRRSYVPTPTVRKKSIKTETILGEIKETVEALKTLSSDNTS